MLGAMHTTRWAAAAVAIGLAVAWLVAANSRPRPNVLVILADDLGQRDLGTYGSTFYETPHLDQLAREGVQFNHAYAAAPVCSPTRASLMTGQWPQRTGITDYIGAPHRPDLWTRNTRALPAPFADRLARETPTLARHMKAAGYATFFAGKWHLGPEGWWPEDHGFDVNMGGIDRGGPYGGNKYFSPYGNPRLPDGPDGEHLPDRLASETVRFMDANRSRPFFAVLSFYSVHTPLMARPDLERKYEEKRRTLGLEPAWGREHERDVRLVQEHAVYAGMVEAMDQAVGKVLAGLDALGLRNDTLVIFTSDNGGLSTSEGWPTSNAPLRAGKGWMYEGGLRVPLLVRWPQRSDGRLRVHAPVVTPDITATVLDAIGARPDAHTPLDGVSLLPVVTKTGWLDDRPIYWHYPHYGNQGGAPAAAIRRGDWKLVEWLEDGRVELFNLAEDEGETADRASSEPARVTQLRQQLHAWQQQVGARMSVANPRYDPAAPSGRAATRTP